MSSPKVSICIPTYNYARFLPEAIDSVLNQTFADYEILIIDDCSEDNTREVVGEYAKKDARITFKINPINIGMVNNWNVCLSEARGEYIKPVFGDDVLSSADALQKMVSILDADRTISLVSTARKFIDPESNTIKIISHFKNDTVLSGEEVINRCLSEQKNLIGEPTAVMFRKRDALRGYLNKYTHIVDLEMWFHFLEKGHLAYIREPLCSFRIHPDQQTKKNTKLFAAAEDNFYLYDGYMNKPYIKIPSLHKKYIRYDNVYHIWKLYKTQNLSKETAIKEIEARYGYAKFLALYPFYKMYKPFQKLYRKIRYGRGLYKIS